MYVPILRKAIGLPNLSTTTISVRTILTLDKRCVHFPTTRRDLQCLCNLLLRTKHRPIVNLLHSTLHTSFMYRRIDQILRWTILRLPRSPTTEHPFRRAFETKRLKNRLFVGRILICRYQSWRLVIQASRRIVHQLFRVLDRPFAVDHI